MNYVSLADRRPGFKFMMTTKVRNAVIWTILWFESDGSILAYDQNNDHKHFPANCVAYPVVPPTAKPKKLAPRAEPLHSLPTGTRFRLNTRTVIAWVVLKQSPRSTTVTAGPNSGIRILSPDKLVFAV